MIRTFTAPARVNLIGEHTDYTGGLVLPMAIPFSTRAAIEAAPDGQYRFESELFGGGRSLGVSDRPGRVGDWSDYPVGVLRELQALGIEVPAFVMRLGGDVPLGAGLSSSASVEVATAVALLSHAGVRMAAEEIALLCQRAENGYVGSPCGIMDQFVVAAATAGHALMLNTRDLTYEHLPMNQGELAGCCVVIVNSGVKHSVATGDYGLRRREVEVGQDVLRTKYPELRDLGDAALAQVAACEGLMPAESYRRCKHVVSENGRVREARLAMLAGDPVRLGEAMTASHMSQRDDFEDSVAEIDFLVETANGIDGCFGARLTGGGFGGCTVNLVTNARAEAFVGKVREAYEARFGVVAETYVCEAVGGAAARLGEGA